MKKLFIGLLVLIFAVPLFAGGRQEQPSTTNQIEKKQVTLHFFQFKPYLDEQYKAFAKEFETKNPNVTIVTETVGGGTQWQTILKSKFAANEGPDIFPVEGVGQYNLWKNYIADLSGQPWIQNALPFALRTLNINGKQMGMPVNLEGYGYIFNKDIFDKVGITVLPKTLSELEVVAKKVKESGYTPFATGYSTWWVLSLHLLNVAFAQQDDPQLFIDQLNNGKAAMAGNELFQDLKNVIDLTVKYGEKNPLTTDHNTQVQLFANGKVAMIQQGVWKEIPIYKANPKANIGLLPIPLNDEEVKMDRIPVGVPFYFVVNKTSTPEVQQAAKNFLNYLVNTKSGQSFMTQKCGFIPAYKGVSPEGLKGVGTSILKYSSQDKVIPWVFGSFPDGFAKEATNILQEYIAGRISWDAALAKLDASWQKLK